MPWSLETFHSKVAQTFAQSRINFKIVVSLIFRILDSKVQHKTRYIKVKIRIYVPVNKQNIWNHSMNQSYENHLTFERIVQDFQEYDWYTTVRKGNTSASYSMNNTTKCHKPGSRNKAWGFIPSPVTNDPNSRKYCNFYAKFTCSSTERTEKTWLLLRIFPHLQV